MSCVREADVWRAIEARHWPERCDDELRAHVAACADCADLVDVAGALVEERDDVVHAAHVPPSGAGWWRAPRRARQEAARAARRAINAVQAAAIVTALAGVFLIAGPNVSHAVADIAAVHWSLPLIAAVASPLLLAPVAVYFAMADD